MPTVSVSTIKDSVNRHRVDIERRSSVGVNAARVIVQMPLFAVVW